LQQSIKVSLSVTLTVLIFGISVCGAGTYLPFEGNKNQLLIKRRALFVIADNMANVATVRTKTGEPYRQKRLAVKWGKDGISSEIKESQLPFGEMTDERNVLADENGNLKTPNFDYFDEINDMSISHWIYIANLKSLQVTQRSFQKSFEMLD